MNIPKHDVSSMKQPLKVLLVEDSEDDAAILKHILKQGGFTVLCKRVESGRDMTCSLEEDSWDLILCDYILPRFNALEALKILKNVDRDIPFIIVSGKIDEETAVGALKAGAHDFVTKGNLSRLLPAINREIEEAQLRLRHRTSEVARYDSEERYRRLAESITDIFFALDRDFKCIFWNRAAEKFTGIHAGYALGKMCTDLFSGMFDSKTIQLFQHTLQSGESQHFSNQTQRNGTQKYFNWYVYPSTTGISVLVRDITESKHAEELRRVHQEMERQIEQMRSLEMLGRLTSGVAHEVRNPLNAISSVTEALFEDLGEKPEFKVYKEYIFTHIDRLKSLMQDLLDLGKPIERSKVSIVPLVDMVESGIAMWHKISTPQGIPVYIDDTGGKENLHIRVDTLKMQQVLFNLLDNAVAHSEPSDKIVVKITHEDPFGIIKIIDQGCGIKPEHMNRLFEPFFTTRPKGTGLGLAIIKHIVTLHDGFIHISNNTPLPGVTAEIQLPLYNEPANKAV